MRRFLPFFISSALGLFCAYSLYAAPQKAQPRWILFGAPESRAESRFSSRGTLEPFPDRFRISPLIELGPQWFSGAQAESEVHYKEERLPLPSAVWNFKDIRLETETFAWGTPDHPRVWVRYRLLNKAPRTIEGKIYFLLRPASGASLRSIEFSEEGKSVRMNGVYTVQLFKKPQEAGFIKKEQGSLMRKIKRHAMPQIQSVKDPQGRASGVWRYPFKIKESEETVFEMTVPLDPDGAVLEKPSYQEALLEAQTYWRTVLNRLRIKMADTALADEVYLNMAALLTLRDHPGFYSDDYRHTGAWTRNTLTAVRTYLNYGFLEEAREDLEMIALRSDLSGEIQPRMKTNPRDSPVREYSLQGEFVNAVWNYYRASGDITWLKAKAGLIHKVLKYLKRLRAQRLRAWYDSGNPDRKRFYGILPPSMDPARGDFKVLHRYEDDLLALKAFKDGRKIQEQIGLSQKAEWMKTEERLLRHALLDSVALTTALANVRFFPVAAEIAVMRPRPATAAVWPAEESGYFPSALMEDHFQKGKDFFEAAKEKDPMKAELFSDFSMIQALLRRGDKEQAQAMFQFQRARLDTGDTAKVSGFLQALRDFFVYESGEKLILGAGILPLWAEGENNLEVKFPTPFGEIQYSVRPVKNGWHVHVEGDAKPPEGFVFCSPAGPARQVFRRLPVDFEI